MAAAGIFANSISREDDRSWLFSVIFYKTRNPISRESDKLHNNLKNQINALCHSSTVLVFKIITGMCIFVLPLLGHMASGVQYRGKVTNSKDFFFTLFCGDFYEI